MTSGRRSTRTDYSHPGTNARDAVMCKQCPPYDPPPMTTADPQPGASAVFAPGLLDGHVVLVTGGGTGLGRASAVELARCGARVVVTGRREEVLGEALAEID